MKLCCDRQIIIPMFLLLMSSCLWADRQAEIHVYVDQPTVTLSPRLYGLYPYPLSRQKTGSFKVDSSPLVRAVGTEGARRATGGPTATPYTSAGVL